MIYRLVKAGYGSYLELDNLQANIIVDMFDYENFCNKYENTYYNKLKERNG